MPNVSLIMILEIKIKPNLRSNKFLIDFSKIGREVYVKTLEVCIVY